MDIERIKYLSEERQSKVIEFVKDLDPVLVKYLSLEKVDLVIEGGRGNGPTMAHISRCLFPAALYVGTDLSTEIARYYGRRWQGNRIKKQELKDILETDKDPDLSMRGAVIFGNCFNEKLIKSIAVATERRFIFLVSFNSINALIDNDASRGEKKDLEDIYSVEEIVGKKSPYLGQLHIINDSVSWDEGEPTCIEYNFHRLEDAGITAGFVSERLSEGLLLVRPELLEKAA